MVRRAISLYLALLAMQERNESGKAYRASFRVNGNADSLKSVADSFCFASRIGKSSLFVGYGVSE